MKLLKSGFRRWAESCRLGSAVLLLWAADAAADTLVIAVGDDYPPYVDSEMPGGGRALTVLQEAAQRAGYTPIVAWSSWNRAMVEVRSGRADMTLPYTYTEDRARSFEATSPIVMVDEYVYVQTGQVAPIAPEDFIGLSGCYPQSYEASGFLNELWLSGEATRHAVFSMEQCFRMLNAGHVDYVLAAEGEAATHLASDRINAEQISRAPVPYSSAPHVALVSRATDDSEEMVARVNAALTEMHYEGKLSALIPRQLPAR